MTKLNEKTLDISLILGALISVIAALAFGFTAECEEMRDNAFRLHILANSDSAADQSLKYDIRDYIIEDLGFIFKSCDTKDETVRLAKRNLALISDRVNGYLLSVGSPYSAVCTVEKCRFGTRKYGDYTLPAGEYDALRIVLGEGKGHNWWCVLFPSVCIPAASSREALPNRALYESEKSKAALTADSLASDNKSGIEYKFLLYEWFGELFGF